MQRPIERRKYGFVARSEFRNRLFTLAVTRTAQPSYQRLDMPPMRNCFFPTGVFLKNRHFLLISGAPSDVSGVRLFPFATRTVVRSEEISSSKYSKTNAWHL